MPPRPSSLKILQLPCLAGVRPHFTRPCREVSVLLMKARELDGGVGGRGRLFSIWPEASSAIMFLDPQLVVLSSEFLCMG